MTEAELLQSLQRSVSMGQMTEQEAQTKWLKWLMSNKSDGSALPSFLQPSTSQGVEGLNVFNPPTLGAGYIGDPAAANEQALLNSTQLDPINHADEIKAATDELAKRKAIAASTTLEQLQNPDELKRTAIATLKGPAQMVNGVVNGVPYMFDKLFGNKADAEQNQQDLAELNDRINQNFGTSDALTPLESLGENAFTAIVPGGIAAKVGALATNYTVDQAVRELTDDKSSPYQTVFDRLNLSGSDSSPTFSPDQAMGAGIAAAVFATVALNPRAVALLKNANQTGAAFKLATAAPKITEISDFDRMAPLGLKTVELSTDATMMQAVDEQKALANILKRAGVPDPAQTEKLITLNSGSAARTRINAAMVSGKLNANGTTYHSLIPVQQIIDGANALAPDARSAIGRYLNLMDMVDDARIAVNAGKVGNHTANIASKLAEAARIVQKYPQAAYFKKAFETAMGAMLDTFDGTIVKDTEAQWLRINRPNYVPGDFSPIDKSANLWTRMRQAQSAGEGAPEDWFLMHRDSVGDYDVDLRADPFTVLQKYTENALNLVMNNEVRKHIVNALQNNKYGEEFVQAVKPEMNNLEHNQHRMIEFIENGEKKQYLTMSETAGIAKFDPYMVRHPWLYLPKRALEKTTTSALTVLTGPFAATSLMRDMFSAAITKPKGMQGFAHPGNILAAIPKQFWAVAKNEFANKIRAGVDAGNSVIPDWLWDSNSRSAFANRVSNQYVNSLYHSLNESGGFDASVNKAHYQYATSALGELRRTVAEASFWNNPAMSNVVSKIGINSAKQVFSWMDNLYHSTMDAARYATAEKLVKQGMSIEDAAIESKKIAGDTSRTGRVFNKEGRHILPDAAYQDPYNVANKTIGSAVQLGREGIPYYNPTVQGMRTALTKFAENPVGFMMRVGLYAQLPSMAAVLWNEMLGGEYNDYAFDQRSADDVAKTLYFGIPGKSPEQGFELPIQQEFMLFAQPFAAALHQLIRGDSSGQMQEAAPKLLSAIARNSVDGSIPPAIKTGLNYFGVDTFGTLGQSLNSAYEIPEDNVGFLPQNLENMARSLFGNMGKTALDTMYILTNDDPNAKPFDDFLDNTYQNYLTNTPIVKQLDGRKTMNVQFSIPGQIAYEKKAAIEKLDPLFKRFYDPDYKNADGFDKLMKKDSFMNESKLPPEIQAMNTDPGDGSQIHPDMPSIYPGPNNQEQPTNPLFPIFGNMLIAEGKNSEVGMSALDDRLAKYKKAVKQLKLYNSGDRAALKQFQTELETGNLQDQNSIELKQIIEDFNIDLTKYQDRVKLINIYENEQSFIYKQKLELYDIIETKITNALKQVGALSGTQSFKIENDLDPYNSTPMGIDVEKLKSVAPKLIELLAKQ